MGCGICCYKQESLHGVDSAGKITSTTAHLDFDISVLAGRFSKQLSCNPHTGRFLWTGTVWNDL